MCTFGHSPFLRCGAVHLDGSKIMYKYRPNGRHISVNLNQHPIGQSRIPIVGCFSRPSKITSHRWSIGPLSKWMVQKYISHVVHWTIVQIDGPNLRLTGGPLDHRLNGRPKLTSQQWSFGPWFFWTVQLCKFGQSKLRHWNQGAFLLLLLGAASYTTDTILPGLNCWQLWVVLHCHNQWCSDPRAYSKSGRIVELKVLESKVVEPILDNTRGSSQVRCPYFWSSNSFGGCYLAERVLRLDHKDQTFWLICLLTVA